MSSRRRLRSPVCGAAALWARLALVTPWVLFALSSIRPHLAAQGSLAPAERAMVQAVDAGNQQALALLERAVNINSGTQNVDGVRQVGQLFKSEFDALGFTTRWVDGAGWNRAGHLVAEHRGSGPRILLIGHLDTVFDKDSPFQRFERLDDHTARGPGIIDMKGGDVIIVAAMKALRAAGSLDRLNLIVVMTGDEEAAGAPLDKARAALIAAAAGAEMAIGFEDGPADPKFAVTARRSSSRWELDVTATPAHSSQIFSSAIGYGAIFEAARIVNAFRERLAGQPHLTFNPGVALGGTAVAFDAATSAGTAAGKSNVVAERAHVSGDIRALTRDQLERAQSAMQAAVASPLAGAKSTLSFEEGYPPMAPTEGNARLLSIYDHASVDLGLGGVAAADPDRAGAADVSFVADRVKMALDGIGLSGHDDHTANETADLSMLAPLTKRAALLLLRVSVEQRPGR